MKAQAVYGSIYGTVGDSTGAAIPNATVTITDTNKGTQQVVQSNGAGNWSADHLIPDTYTVRIEAGSFSSAEAKGVEIHADASQKVDIALQPAGSATTIQVSANDTPALKTDRADVAQILDQRSLGNLPNLNRNFTQFALLTPGVQHSSFNISGPEDPQGSVSLNTNGSNYGVQGFLLDGTDNRDPVLGIIVINPTLDSVGELKVTSANYDAEFGGAVGGIVSAQTKSGSNTLHGDVFFYRHTDANLARDPFAQSTPDAVTGRYIPSQSFGQYGGSVSGPIWKDKTFFFLDYQGTRQKVGTSFLSSVPTTLVRNTCLTAGSATCDLSEYAGGKPLYVYPTSGGTPTAYTNGVIPTSRLSPQAIALLRLLPAPNLSISGTQNNFAASGNGVNNGDQADARIDHQFNSKAHAFGRYDIAFYRLQGNAAFGAAGGPGFGLTGTSGTDKVQNQSAAIGLDYALSGSVLTDVRAGFLAYHVAENKLDAGTNPASALGIPNLNTGSFDTSGLPTFNVTDSSITNFGSQGCNCPLLESEQVFQLANNWTKIIGNHSIKFGGDVRYALNLRNASDNNRAGLFSFNSGQTAGTGGQGVGLASLLVGQADRFQRFDVFQQNAANRQKRGAFYGQDSWRVTPKLTVNYGVRWDIIFPETVNSPGNGGFANLATGSINVAGVGGFGTNGGQKMDYTNVAGRFGFAYQVHPTTVIRGGIGQVYDDVGFFGTLFGSALTHNLPVLANEDTNASNATGQFATTLGAPPIRVSAPIIPSNGQIPLTNSVSPTFRGDRIQLPRVDQWNLTVQQQLTPNMTLQVAYVGNHAERIYPGETEGYDLNAPVLPTSPADLTASDTDTTGVSFNRRRPFFGKFNNGLCCSNGLTSAQPSANANYHSLQTVFEKRLANGLQFNANYTWSKAMNYANDEAFARYPGVSYGPNDTNRAHVLVFSSVYQLPFGKNGMYLRSSNRLINGLVSGYTVSGNTTWESGLPFTPTYAECGSDQDIDKNFAGPGTTSDCRPDGNAHNLPTNVGGLNPVTHSRAYFTPVAALTSGASVTTAFQRPAFGTFGNVGRNSLRGPHDYFADASLSKDIPLSERFHGQLQAQAFNVFNHAALGVPSASQARCVDCSTGGVITGLEPNNTMRQLQFSGKIQF
ncbi:TonB-dependent receptor [Granulicella arctica]|uniref:TonB-dependent receptor n=1 Tax=Granulicella arctica TaxID=940613 RepID=UPI0021DFBCDF|nr:TonB-dependent receptor [Granulicella arctica]